MTEPSRPAYLLVLARVADRAKIGAYQAALDASGLYAKHGGATLLRGPAAVELEDWGGEAAVCSVFPSRAHAEAFWTSAQYTREIKPLREGAGEFHVAIFDALPG